MGWTGTPFLVIKRSHGPVVSKGESEVDRMGEHQGPAVPLFM